MAASPARSFSPDSLITIDAFPYHRSHAVAPDETHTFYGLLAVALSVEDPASFASDYERILDEVCTSAFVPRLRRVYKAYDINRILAGSPTRSDPFYFQFARKLLGLDGVKLNAFTGAFDLERFHQEAGVPLSGDRDTDFKKNKVVPVYGRNPGRTYVSVNEFIDLIADSFPAIAAWKLTQKTGIYRRTFLLDGFPGHLSKSWDVLSGENNVRLLPHGDTCNPCISAADLTLRAIDRRLFWQRNRLSPSGVRTALSTLASPTKPADTHVTSVSNDDLDWIAPYDVAMVPHDPFLLHPVLFLLSEASDARERYEVEASPLYRSVQDKAYELGGCYLNYHYKTSPSLIQPQDYVVTYGPKGQATVAHLRSLGFTFNEWRTGGGAADSPPP